MSDNAAFDDEFDTEFTIAAHSAPLSVMAGVFGQGGAVELCDHSHELQSMRLTIENLRANVEYWQGAAQKCLQLARDLEARVDNLTAELSDARRLLEVANDAD